MFWSLFKVRLGVLGVVNDSVNFQIVYPHGTFHGLMKTDAAVWYGRRNADVAFGQIQCADVRVL